MDPLILNLVQGVLHLSSCGGSHEIERNEDLSAGMDLIAEVEVHRQDGDGSLYIWGKDNPGTELEDFGAHKGTRILMDDKVVFCNLTVLEEEEDGHEEDCELCVKAPA